MMNYRRCNGCKRFYIGGSMIRVCDRVLFGLLAQWLERHPYKMCGPGSIPG